MMVFWIILVVLTGLILGGSIVSYVSYRYDETGNMISCLSGLCLFFILMFWLANYTSEITFLQEYTSTKNTIETSRTGQIDYIEKAAMQNKIIEINQHLASTKYWDKYFDPAYPDKVVKLDYLK